MRACAHAVALKGNPIMTKGMESKERIPAWWILQKVWSQSNVMKHRQVHVLQVHCEYTCSNNVAFRRDGVRERIARGPGLNTKYYPGAYTGLDYIHRLSQTILDNFSHLTKLGEKRENATCLNSVCLKEWNNCLFFSLSLSLYSLSLYVSLPSLKPTIETLETLCSENLLLRDDRIYNVYVKQTQRLPLYADFSSSLADFFPEFGGFFPQVWPIFSELIEQFLKDFCMSSTFAKQIKVFSLITFFTKDFQKTVLVLIGRTLGFIWTTQILLSFRIFKDHELSLS